MDMTDKNIQDGLRENLMVKVGLTFKGFRQVFLDDSVALRQQAFNTEKSSAKAKKQVWTLEHTVFLKETGVCVICVEGAACSLLCQQLAG